MNPLVHAERIPKSTRDLKAFADRFGVTVKAIKKIFRKQQRGQQMWINELYVVHKRPVADGWIELSIRRQDRGHVVDWRHKQAIKNQLCGEECEGLELFPAESRLYDSANQFWIYVRAEPGELIPVGFNEGRHVSDEDIGGSKQRPFEEDDPK